MKGIVLSVIAAFAVMAGPMALAGQAHGDHDKDKDDAHHRQTVHTTTRTIHHRGGSQTVTYYNYAHPRGDKDHDKDDRKRHHSKKHNKKGHSKSWVQAVTHRK